MRQSLSDLVLRHRVTARVDPSRPGDPLQSLGRCAHAPEGLLHRRPVFRTGSANFSHSGLTQHDNDLLMRHSPAACTLFEAKFANVWGAK